MKKVKVAFREQSKTVTAEVEIVYEGEDKSNEDILNETNDLMASALTKAQNFKIEKIRRG